MAMKIFTPSAHRNIPHFNLCCFSSPTSASHWTSHQRATTSAAKMEIGCSDANISLDKHKELRSKWSCTLRYLASQLRPEV